MFGGGLPPGFEDAFGGGGMPGKLKKRGKKAAASRGKAKRQKR